MFNSVRARTRVCARFGEAEGSMLGLVTFNAMRTADTGLRRFCAESLLPQLEATQGIITGALLEPLPEEARPSGLPPLRRSGRELHWIIAMESGHVQRLTDAMHTSRVLERLADQGANEVGFATYRLTFRISP
jgi:hypothetical protein